MANLDGSRSHGATWDKLAGATLRQDVSRFSVLYRTLLTAARTEGIGQDALPDFLNLENGGELDLLGQEELSISIVEAVLDEQLKTWRKQPNDLSREDTERILLQATRVGQHRFASEVLANCGHRCVFCGFAPPSFGASRMLLASHIKPWRDSSPRERLDKRNGLAACPTHDVAFDTGLLTVNGELRIHRSSRLVRGVADDPVARLYFAQPPLRRTLLLPEGAEQPLQQYLHWHQYRIYTA
ncbi:HNH endonuclease [Georgenia daeguensis]